MRQTVFGLIMLGLLAVAVYFVDGYINELKQESKELSKLVADRNIIKVERDSLLIANINLQKRISAPLNPYIPDELYFAGYRVPLERSYVRRLLKNELSRLLASERNREVLETFARGIFWFPLIEDSLRAEGFPDDLKWLYAVESNYRIIPCSQQGACGLTQFMPATARANGLVVNGQIDERFFPELAIPASIRFLKKLRDEHLRGGGDMCLVMQAYNAGPGHINKAVERYGEQNCFAIRVFRETHIYHYRAYAFKLLWEYRDRYGIQVSETELREFFYHPPVRFVDVTLSGTTHVDEIARRLGVFAGEFSELNHHVRVSELSRGTYKFRVPIEASIQQ